MHDQPSSHTLNAIVIDFCANKHARILTHSRPRMKVCSTPVRVRAMKFQPKEGRQGVQGRSGNAKVMRVRRRIRVILCAVVSCVAICCSSLQCIRPRLSTGTTRSELQCDAGCCIVWQRAVACCSVFAMCFTILHVYTHTDTCTHTYIMCISPNE